MSTTMTIEPLCITAPAEVAGDNDAALDFLAGEFFLAKVYGNDDLEVTATTEALPTLALAAAAFDAADMPANFRLVELVEA
ncbi:hypothetical protein NYP18_00790 [Corynebacterium sp. YIM 101645]|uniref:Uncharacterized protein n=1 Tax=Corynebacterium lemuris TaxID=1859292 RepID=A0ABT2FSL0_9CORY|nr:hypothetical protein [Corynebacterium lemuris]MCS5478191.1 hypothetical protein [Corynebacterium lemuris]